MSRDLWIAVVSLSSVAALLACGSGVLREEIAARLEGIQPGEARETMHGVVMRMHRIDVGEPLSDGWYRAGSSNGYFTVEVPLPANDFSQHARTVDGVLTRVDTVGTRTMDGQWVASCSTRADGRLSPPGKPGPEPTEELSGDPPFEHGRTIVAGRRVCILSVKALSG